MCHANTQCTAFTAAHYTFDLNINLFQVMLEPTLTYAILGVWSWSLLQFCFVLGAAAGGEQGRRRKKSAREEENEGREKDRCCQIQFSHQGENMDSYISFLTSFILANRNMGFKVGSGAGSNSSSFNSKASSNSNTNNSGDREDQLT